MDQQQTDRHIDGRTNPSAFNVFRIAHMLCNYAYAYVTYKYRRIGSVINIINPLTVVKHSKLRERILSNQPCSGTEHVSQSVNGSHPPRPHDTAAVVVVLLNQQHIWAVKFTTRDQLPLLNSARERPYNPGQVTPPVAPSPWTRATQGASMECHGITQQQASGWE